DLAHASVGAALSAEALRPADLAPLIALCPLGVAAVGRLRSMGARHGLRFSATAAVRVSWKSSGKPNVARLLVRHVPCYGTSHYGGWGFLFFVVTPSSRAMRAQTPMGLIRNILPCCCALSVAAGCGGTNQAATAHPHDVPQRPQNSSDVASLVSRIVPG